MSRFKGWKLVAILSGAINIKLINLTENTSETIVNYKYGNTYESFDYTTLNYVWTMDNGRTGRYLLNILLAHYII